MKIYQFSPDISLIDLALSIPGSEGILGAYVIKSDKTALIDVGPNASLENLFAALDGLKVDPGEVEYILSTHIHLDHLGGLGGALKRMPRAMAVVHERGIRHLVNPEKLWEGSKAVLGQIALNYGKPEPVPENRLIPAREGLVIDLGGIQIETLLTPGHAPHHLSFIDRQRGTLFPGEAAGVYFPDTKVSRPASPPPFNLLQALSSVNKLIEASPREIYYSHFGYSPEAMPRLMKYREQLIFWGRIIASCLEDDPAKIADEILTLDGTKESIYRFPPERLQTELYFINNNIKGYLDYFRREGTGVLNDLSLLSTD